MSSHLRCLYFSEQRAKQIALDKLDEMTNAEWIIGEQTQSEVRIPGLNPKVKVEFALTRISGSCAKTSAPNCCAS